MANIINTLFGRVLMMERHMDQMENKLNNMEISDQTIVNKINITSVRTLDGSANNMSKPNWGKTHTKLLRKAPSQYGDNQSSLAVRGAKNPNPRVISNLLCKSSTSIPNTDNLSDMMWIWGQFLDHEVDLTDTQSNTGEITNMITPTVAQDPNEDYPNRTIPFTRSSFVVNTNPREHPNSISSYIDATNVYGYDNDRGYALRRLDGSGKLITRNANNGEVILPYNLDGLKNAAPEGSNPSDFFLAGDIRSNENIFLTAMHTLFVREHNRLCDQVLSAHPEYLNMDEMIYQHARKLLIAMMQNITYTEFLPKLLGNSAIPTYTSYDENVDASITTEFSTVGYRVGHSMLSSVLRTGQSGTILLRNAFFNPSYIQTNGIDQLLLGGSLGTMQKIDTRVVEDIRSFLFGAPTAQQLLDLAALNMQRGRDHGIPDYNTLRAAYGLTKVSAFTEVTSDVTVSNGLAQLYDTVDDIDPWIGGLAEDHVSGAQVGPLFYAIIRDQFIRLRDGDRYYYENDKTITNEEKNMVREFNIGSNDREEYWFK